jgi:hypothetical protein
VLLAPAAALQDLGALIFSDDALDLLEQGLLGSTAGRIAEEDDRDAATGELLEEQDQISLFAREPIRVEDVEAVEASGGGLVPESFEVRTDQGVPAVAVIDEAELGVAGLAVIRDPLQEHFELAGDRILLGLLVPRDPGIESHTKPVIGHGWSSSLGR